MRRTKPTIEEYEALAARFNPVKFDADEWVRVAKEAGMKYIVITAKHHDGFAMWHSKASEFNIVDGTPYDRDPLKELAEACRKTGLQFCVYYSQYSDWHEPNAGGNTWTFDEPRDFSIYYERKCKPQIKELLTGYGPLGLIWFDQPGAITRAQSQELADMVHEYQPPCLVSTRIGHGTVDWECGPSRSPARAGAVLRAKVRTEQAVGLHPHGKAVVARSVLRLVTEAFW